MASCLIATITSRTVSTILRPILACDSAFAKWSAARVSTLARRSQGEKYGSFLSWESPGEKSEGLRLNAYHSLHRHHGGYWQVIRPNLLEQHASANPDRQEESLFRKPRRSQPTIKTFFMIDQIGWNKSGIWMWNPAPNWRDQVYRAPAYHVNAWYHTRISEWSPYG